MDTAVDVPIKIEARTFINQWGREMRNTYVVTLTTTPQHEQAFSAMLADFTWRWEDAHVYAQAETLGDFWDSAKIEKRYIIAAKDYPRFKDDLKATKAAYNRR